jgi:two-component system sensor histidine kinase/response regulator
VNPASQLSQVRAAIARSGVEAPSFSEDLVRVLTAESPLGVFVAGSTGEVRYVNKRWCELTGLTPEQALGTGWAAALHRDDAARATSAWAAAVASGESSVCEYRLQRADGSVSWVEAHSSPLRTDGGAVTGWVGCAST